MRKRHPLAVTLIVAALTLSACGGGGSSEGGDRKEDPATTEPTGDKESTGGASEIEIADFAYDPGDAEVAVGETVTFTNSDSATHTATADGEGSKGFDTGEIEGDGSAEVSFDEAGDYSYYCSIHEYMTGTIRVLE